jgi:hypothetical protein
MTPIHFKVKISDEDKILEILNFIKENNLFAFITVKVFVPLDIYIPPLPRKINNDKIEDKLIFKTGRLVQTYSRVELLNSIKYGINILEIYEIIIFSSGKPIEFYSKINIDFKIQRDLSKNKVIRRISKLLINSIYGKIGSKSYNTIFKIIKTNDALKDNNIKFVHYTIGRYVLASFFNNKVFKRENKSTNIAIAAAITSIGRVLIYERLIYILNNNKNREIIYIDTDSLIIGSDKKELNIIDRFNNHEIL